MPPSAPYLLIVRNGPVYDLEKTLGFFSRTFGSHFEGEICTYGNDPDFFSAAGFDVRRYGWRNSRNLLRRAGYVAWVLRRAVRARWFKRRRLIMIAYDPFQSGMIGVLVKWFTGATFICEVNGVYGDDDNLVDMPDPEQRAERKRSMLRFGSWVLRRADFVKVLFPEQLAGFAPDALERPRTWFFDLIDADTFQPRGLEPEKRIVFAGHPFLRKGLDILLQAWARTRDDFPEWTLSLVGWAIEEPARKRGLPTDGVVFVPPSPPSELATLIEASAGLILPSRSEGMGRVLLEAALLGRPRLGSRVGGIPYYIDDDVDGLLFDPVDVDALEAVLRRFMGDEALRARLGAAARERALKSFTSAEYVRRYAEVVKDLTGWERAPSHRPTLPSS